MCYVTKIKKNTLKKGISSLVWLIERCSLINIAHKIINIFAKFRFHIYIPPRSFLMQNEAVLSQKINNVNNYYLKNTFCSYFNKRNRGSNIIHTLLNIRWTFYILKHLYHVCVNFSDQHAERPLVNLRQVLQTQIRKKTRTVWETMGDFLILFDL